MCTITNSGRNFPKIKPNFQNDASKNVYQLFWISTFQIAALCEAPKIRLHNNS